MDCARNSLEPQGQKNKYQGHILNPLYYNLDGGLIHQFLEGSFAKWYCRKGISYCGPHDQAWTVSIRSSKPIRLLRSDPQSTVEIQ
jgi:hypothetical protein